MSSPRRWRDGSTTAPSTPTKTTVLHHLRDSVPILSSASVPCLILAAAWVGWLEPRTAQLAAEIVILLRIGGTVFVIDRLNNERPNRATLIGGNRGHRAGNRHRRREGVPDALMFMAHRPAVSAADPRISCAR